METAVVLLSALLVLGSIWAGDWLGRAIAEYRDDENHR